MFGSNAYMHLLTHFGIKVVLYGVVPLDACFHSCAVHTFFKVYLVRDHLVWVYSISPQHKTIKNMSYHLET